MVHVHVSLCKILWDKILQNTHADQYLFRFFRPLPLQTHLKAENKQHKSHSDKTQKKKTHPNSFFRKSMTTLLILSPSGAPWELLVNMGHHGAVGERGALLCQRKHQSLPSLKHPQNWQIAPEDMVFGLASSINTWRFHILHGENLVSGSTINFEMKEVVLWLTISCCRHGTWWPTTRLLWVTPWSFKITEVFWRSCKF